MSPTSSLDVKDNPKQMSSEQLHKLEQLASQRADRSRNLLVREKQELAQIDQHCQELRTINREYQQSLLGGTEVTPQLLAHRRAFVEQLTQRLEGLSEQREQKFQTVQKKAEEHHHCTAQHTAIELVNEHRAEANDKASVRREQQQLDGNAQAQHNQRQHIDREQGND